MTIFNNTPSESTLNKAAYCVLYEVIKDGAGNILDLRVTLKEYVEQCETLSSEQKEELKPIYERAYELSKKYTFKKLKELAREVGSDYTTEL